MAPQGTDRGRGFIEADYTEGLFIGYRYFDQMQLSPLFPFGHGLSYTTFSYSALAVQDYVSPTQGATVTALITNTGPVGGAEVAQLYLVFPPEAHEPPQLLRGFSKVLLEAKAAAAVKFTLQAEDVSVFDEGLDDWRIVPGEYEVRVGASSRDIRLVGRLTVKGA